MAIDFSHSKLKIIFLYWLPVVIYAGLIFFFSSLPYGFKGPKSVYFDKLLHLAEYFIFGILLSRAFIKSLSQFSVIKCYLFVVVIACLYGISDEIHQLFVEGREFSIYDIFADTIGGSLGALIYRFKFTPPETDRH